MNHLVGHLPLRGRGPIQIPKFSTAERVPCQERHQPLFMGMELRHGSLTVASPRARLRRGWLRGLGGQSGPYAPSSRYFMDREVSNSVTGILESVPSSYSMARAMRAQKSFGSSDASSLSSTMWSTRPWA